MASASACAACSLRWASAAQKPARALRRSSGRSRSSPRARTAARMSSESISAGSSQGRRPWRLRSCSVVARASQASPKSTPTCIANCSVEGSLADDLLAADRGRDPAEVGAPELGGEDEVLVRLPHQGVRLVVAGHADEDGADTEVLCLGHPLADVVVAGDQEGGDHPPGLGEGHQVADHQQVHTLLPPLDHPAEAHLDAAEAGELAVVLGGDATRGGVVPVGAEQRQLAVAGAHGSRSTPRAPRSRTPSAGGGWCRGRARRRRRGRSRGRRRWRSDPRRAG